MIQGARPTQVRGPWPRILRPLATLTLLITFKSCTILAPREVGRAVRRVEVYADEGWQDPGQPVDRGQRVVVEAISGQWFEDPPGVWHDADGGPDPWVCGKPDCHEPLPFYPKYALIGRIGQGGQPFPVGTYVEFVSATSGKLYLRANYGDEDIPIHQPEGSIEVRIEVE